MKNTPGDENPLAVMGARAPWLAPIAAAICYPFLLKGFHTALSLPAFGLGPFFAAAWLAAAMGVPLVGFATALFSTRQAPTNFMLRARRIAYLTIGVPPLFVLTGVLKGLLHQHVADELIWSIGWLAAGAYVLAANFDPAEPPETLVTRWRVAHGVAAAILLIYVTFHLINHLGGLGGPDLHAAIMKAGRRVYRAPLIEPLLIGLLLFQVASGLRLAWRWSAVPSDGFRIFQIGSGVYLGTFVLTHLNSALISARAIHKIETDWAWASGAPIGLLHDAWNIRLVPHYGFGVFFVLAHLSSGLRAVSLAHGAEAQIANRLWAVGLAASGLVSLAIMAGLCGVRL